MITKSGIEQQLLEFVKREILPHSRNLSVGSDLVEEGFDSLSLVNLLLFIEKRYGVWIPEKAITKAAIASIAKVAETVLKHLNESKDLHERR
jgi:acyl carrier protein